MRKKFIFRGTVETATPARYLRMLCKHWWPRLEVRYDEMSGEIYFNQGSCHLDARQSGLLLIQVTGPDVRICEGLKAEVAHLLDRFGTRAKLTVKWEGQI